MTPRIVLSLAVAAAISSAGAYFAYRSTHVFVPQAGIGEKVLPGLADKINDVTRITVAQDVRKLVLEKSNGVWQVAATKYPLSAAKVKKTFVSLIGLEKLEAKTANSEKYPLVHVDEPGRKDSKGRRIDLIGKNGEKIASIIIGKLAVGKAGPGKDAQYVRNSNDKTSWLALGSVDATVELKSWADPRFIGLNVDTVTHGRIVRADGEVIEVRRTGKSDTGSSIFELVNLPEGRKAKTSTTLKFAATDWVNLDFEDVRPANSGGKLVLTSTITTDDGLKVIFTLKKDAGKGWVSLDVAAPGKDKKKAGKITRQTKGWQFQLADYKFEQLNKKMEDLLEKQK